MKRIDDENLRIYSMGPQHDPKAWVKSGDMLQIVTNDWFASGRDYAKELFESGGNIDINPATGPIGVKGAEPGDVLKIEILEIELIGKGMMFSIPGQGLFAQHIQQTETKVIEIKDGYAHFSNQIKIPLEPMIGVIGTAPLVDVPCYIPGRHGANMDTRQVKKGSSIYLPVFIKGGNFALGDLHGAMGDGEISDWGLETSGMVTVRVDVLKTFLNWPVIQTQTDYFLVVSETTLEKAIQEALNASYELVKACSGLKPNDCASLLSLIGNLEISQVVNPLKTVRMRFDIEMSKTVGLFSNLQP